MITELVVAAALIVLIVLLLVRVPVAFALLGAGALGLLLLDGFDVATRTLASEPYQAVASYTLIVIPMFILMGMFAMESGVAEGAFRVANKLVGWLPGGLGIATVLVCATFAAVSGSSPATVATVGRIAIPQMRSRGYSREFTAGIIGTAGTLGVLIPPSIVMVIFGIATGVSIGELLVGGILPGVLSVVVLSAYIIGRAVLRPQIIQDRSYAFALVDSLSDGGNAGRRSAEMSGGVDRAAESDVAVASAHIPGTPEDASSLGRGSVLSLLSVMIMFGVVIGGIYSGVVTATESAAFGALTGLIILVISRRKSRKLGGSVLAAMRETASTTCMIFAIIIGASVLSVFLVRSGVTTAVSSAMLSVEAPPGVIVIGVLLLMLPLGMFLDATSIILITMPVIWPTLDALGVDGVWFGILIVVMIEIGLITPPVGINGFVLSGISKDISVEQGFRGLAPFVVVELAIVAILFTFPQIVTFLPSVMGG